MGYFILAGLLSLVGFIISQKLKNKFRHYSQIGIRSGLSGREIAENMLKYYGIHDVRIEEGHGMLTDHYNPMSKVVNLSPDVFNGRTIAAAAVAAHECGHAVQHNQAYAWLTMRSAVVPIVNIASSLQQWLLMLALGLFGSGGNQTILFITMLTFLVTAVFSLITLPVEFDASKRALVWLNHSGITHGAEQEGAKDALWWAAMTYVSAAFSALVMLLYFALRFFGSSND
ncbi:MAG: zinc metallopeptidase [Saprospiraceae bacterium]|jgi:hypothetical protein|nr:zinc metallopeptidase [Saprospiraceae bacterium]MDP4701007.1 zinc metallopeptidase [Saprospiraceae bacterium]MDP4810021.1 zinc metallopeptidase [Saprospiraceae bacterium]MDP4812985.1 zinc metallopeptidase [Saprospiraceae bacterium]MDP4913972.1 zinc metallopeptidase [Saprospiraceae bacterium]